MQFRLLFTEVASAQLDDLKSDPGLEKRLKAALKTLGLMSVNLRHPSLNTHEYNSLSTSEYKVFEAYAENCTPGAYRVFWRYGPPDDAITVLAITPHP